jgi:tetratricopeptide (TPR) repeat protein
MLLRLLAERWDGTLLVHDTRDEPIAALRLDAGCVVTARVEGASGSLLQQVAELCAVGDAHFILVDRSDLVGRGPDVARGRIDPARLAALREQARHASAPPRRVVSGAVVRASAQPASLANPIEEPTVVVTLDATARRLDASHRESLVDDAEDTVKRLRCADPNASRAVHTERYHVQNPEHGTTRSQPPRRMRSAPPRADADTYFHMAEKLLARGDCRSAVLEAQKGMKLGTPRPWQRALYAWLLYRRAESREVPSCVWAHLQQAFDADPNCARAFYYKGLLLARTGRRAEALTYLERARQLDPNDAQAEHTLSEFRHARSRLR